MGNKLVGGQPLPDDVWEATRFIWENTPSISDRELVDLLAQHFGKDAPKSGGTISKRRTKDANNDDEWVKRSLVVPDKTSPKKSAKTGRKQESSARNQSKNRNQSIEKNTVIPSKTNKAQNMESVRNQESKSTVLDDIMDSVVLSAKDRAAIIVKNRRRYQNIGSLFEQSLRITLSISELADEAIIAEQKALEGNYGADFAIGENKSGEGEAADAAEFAVEKLKRALMLSKSLSDTTNSLAASLKMISEVELPLCGITPEDFKQSEQERRLGALEGLGDIYNEEREAREALTAELNDRLRWIEDTASSSDFGQPEKDDDIEDIDYVQVDD